MTTLTLAFRLARRELRGGLKGWRVFLACLALGVAAIAAIGALSQAVQEGIRSDGKVILGGDVAFRTVHRPAKPDHRAFIAGAGTVFVKTAADAFGRLSIDNAGRNAPAGSTHVERVGRREITAVTDLGGDRWEIDTLPTTDVRLAVTESVSNGLATPEQLRRSWPIPASPPFV